MMEEDEWKKITARGLQAAYPDRPRSEGYQQPAQSSLSIRRSISENSLSLPQSAVSQPLFPGLKKIQIKKEDHTLRNVLGVVALLLLAILSIDIKSELQREWHRYELQAQHCYAEYTQNECVNPIEAMRARCKELQICYSTKIDHKIKITTIFASLIGKAFHTCANSAGLPGSIFLMCLICAILFFAYKSSKATMTLKKD